MKLPFRNRLEAGQVLARALEEYGGRRDVLILGLPRGGVAVAFEVAEALQAPLDVLLVGKLGVPGHEELAMGAIASGGVCALNQDVINSLDISPEIINSATRQQEVELERRDRMYRGERSLAEVRGRIVILVDDGVATGATMRVGIKALKARHPARLVVAVPVGAADTVAELRREVDEFVCLATPEPFSAVGRWYLDFSPTSDTEVCDLLREAQRARPVPGEEVAHLSKG